MILKNCCCRLIKTQAVNFGKTSSEMLGSQFLQKKKQDVTSFEVQVHADQAEEFPKVFTHVVITYLISGHAVDEAAVLRAIELSATKYCPAQAMLGKVAPVELVYQIYESEGNGKMGLQKQGKYQLPGK